MSGKADNEFFENYISSNSNDNSIDISSYSTNSDYDIKSNSIDTPKTVIKNEIEHIGEASYSNIGNIIKVLAFIFGFGVLIVAIGISILMFASKSGLSVLSVLVIIFGVIIAAMMFFPIYGLGHAICQNNEILKLLRKR